MDGLAVDRRRKAGKEDYLFMHFRGNGCRSDSPRPGGTAEPASVRQRSSPRQELRMLERKARHARTVCEHEIRRMRVDELRQELPFLRRVEQGMGQRAR